MRKLILLIIIFAAFCVQANATPSPHGISGTVYDLDGITQVAQGTWISVNDTTNGNFVSGTTGRPGGTGKYYVAIDGDNNDVIIITAWNIEHSSKNVTNLQGVMKDVNLYLNTTISPRAPDILSMPITTATEDSLYAYEVDAADYNGDTVTYSLITKPSGMQIGSSSGIITWTPANSDVGSHLVNISASDGTLFSTQSFNISVSNVNDNPVFTSSPVTAATEDQLYNYNVDATDPDVGDAVTYVLTDAPSGMSINSGTGLISWTPTGAQSGDNIVTVTVTDGNGGIAQQSFTITVAAVNDAPVINSPPVTTAMQGVLYQYDVLATDEEGDAIAYSLQASPTGMSINSGTGLITWTPTNSQVGNNSVTVRADDGQDYSDQEFIINVSNVNDLPAISSLPSTTAAEGVEYTYQVVATDPDNDTITYSLLQSPAGMAINSSTGLMRWTPTAGQKGYNNITVGASDSTGTTQQPFTVYSQSINHAPVIYSEPITDVFEGEHYEYFVDAYDADNDVLYYSFLEAPDEMLIDVSSGYASWDPGAGTAGNYTITVRVSDGYAVVNQTYFLTVEAQNHVPDITSEAPQTATAGSLYSYQLNATDPDGDSINYTLANGPSGMQIDNETGLLTWTPGNGDAGQHVIRIEVNDYELTAIQLFLLTVEAQPTTEQPSSGSGITGDVSAGGGAALSKITEKFENSPVTQVEVKFKSPVAASVAVEALSQRPLWAKSIEKRVYSYLNITINKGAEGKIDEATISFKVLKGWLLTNKVNSSNIALYRYNNNSWAELPTEKGLEDNDFVYYSAKTPGFSLFAIALKEEKSLEEINSINEPKLTGLPQFYSILGTILEGDGTPVSGGTDFFILNLNNNRNITGKTGYGSDAGLFLAIMQGNKGDILFIRVESKSGHAQGELNLTGDMDGIILVADYKTGKLHQIGYMPAEQSRGSWLIAIAALIIVAAATAYFVLKKRGKNGRQ